MFAIIDASVRLLDSVTVALDLLVHQMVITGYMESI